VRINNQQRYQKTKNSKLFALHSSVFHTLKSFSYLVLPKGYKQKHHTPPEVLILLTPHLTKSHSKNTKNFTSHQNLCKTPKSHLHHYISPSKRYFFKLLGYFPKCQLTFQTS